MILTASPALTLSALDAPIPPEPHFLALAHGGRNVFLTGMAGTGKSFLLKRFISESMRRVDVTAPTGVAALNVGGMTIHRFCGIMLGPQPGQTDEAYFAILEKDTRPSVRAGFSRVRRCEALVIDEISMMPGRTLNFVEFLFRKVRGNDQSFGGCQVIVSGDFLQLPPVRKDEREAYDWSFSSDAWVRAQFFPICLETVRRQDEPQFVAALGDFRRGRLFGNSARLLMSRIVQFPSSKLTRLFTHNVQVDKWNNFQLGELPGDVVTLEATRTGPETQVAFLENNLLTPGTLLLKPGAQVMFTVNKSEPGRMSPTFVNGQTGIVQKIAAGYVSVEVSSGALIDVQPFTWSFAQDDDRCGKFTQFPLRLAWAMTIHKSQGLTLDNAYLDIRAAREPGQAYVAVSRVRTLAGLHFKEWPKGIHVSPEALQFYESL
jgi:ATP-dependent DNA helicase PIF1